eukprot:6310169-Lingulodinium_polyedra.AAC.1
MISLLALTNCIGIVSLFVCMAPNTVGVGQNRDFNYRIPPSWGPAIDSVCSFRAYVAEISLWVMLTDLQSHQQSAAIVV